MINEIKRRLEIKSASELSRDIAPSVIRPAMEVANKIPPAIDGAAAQALRASEVGARALWKLSGGVKQAGELALDIADPARPDKKEFQEFMRHQAPGALIIASLYDETYLPIPPAVVPLQQVKSWQAANIFEKGTVIGIHTLVDGQDETRKSSSHDVTAELIHFHLDQDPDLVPIIVEEKEPVRMGGKTSPSSPNGPYDALYRAELEFRLRLYDLAAQKAKEHGLALVTPRSVSVYVANPESAERLSGVRQDFLRNLGSLVFLKLRGKRNFTWRAPKTVPYMKAESDAENLRQVETALVGSDKALEARFPGLGRSLITAGRFTRDGDRQPVGSPERTNQN